MAHSLLQIIPAVHWVALNNSKSEIVSLFLPRIIGVYGLIGIGVAFYVSLMPERLRPGMFDLLGSSHQWWHIFVTAAFIWWYNSGVGLRDYRHAHECPPRAAMEV